MESGEVFLDWLLGLGHVILFLYNYSSQWRRWLIGLSMSQPCLPRLTDHITDHWLMTGLLTDGLLTGLPTGYWLLSNHWFKPVYKLSISDGWALSLTLLQLQLLFTQLVRRPSSLPSTLEVLNWTSILSLVIVFNNQLATWVIAFSSPCWPKPSSLRIQTKTPCCRLNTSRASYTPWQTYCWTYHQNSKALRLKKSFSITTSETTCQQRSKEEPFGKKAQTVTSAAISWISEHTRLPSNLSTESGITSTGKDCL